MTRMLTKMELRNLQIEEELRQLGQQIYKPLDVTLHYRNQGFYEWIDEIPHNHHKDGFNSVTFGTLNLEVQKRVFTPRSDLEILSGDEAIVTTMELHDQRNNGERTGAGVKVHQQRRRRGVPRGVECHYHLHSH